ncbi:hypothetical protein HMPREF3226_02209 [Prevotella corporis]|uniref:Uncharacterized protein n=1 Tax=Prevotella corporis TaxID=28128 RepID=A0A133PXL0_9BACT|nr:hypothetical protein HMPREF3226_02209 [Prevotella corporis]
MTFYTAIYNHLIFNTLPTELQKPNLSIFFTPLFKSIRQSFVQR